MFKTESQQKVRTNNYSSSALTPLSIWRKAIFKGLFALLLLSVDVVSAPEKLKIEIKIVPKPKPVVEINGTIGGNQSNTGKYWRFLDAYAGSRSLAKRIRNLQLKDDAGNDVGFKKFVDGEFVADRPAQTFSYEMDLENSGSGKSAAHVSWLRRSYGLMMLNDLIPRVYGHGQAALVDFEVPLGWKISTKEKQPDSSRRFLVSDIENAMFLVGKGWRTRGSKVGQTDLTVNLLGKWKFEDAESIEIASSTLAEYKRLFGEPQKRKVHVFILPFQNKKSYERWNAETRGENIVIISSDAAFKSRSSQLLKEMFRHELFHLWIPGSLNLKGDFAWFYEGFAMYQSLKTGVWLGQIRLEDYLATMSMAFSLNGMRDRNESLLTLNDDRFGSGISNVYIKGTIAAFLCDLAILRQSRGKRDLTTVFGRLLKKHGTKSDPTVANDAILKIMEEYKELKPIVDTYIRRGELIDISPYISPFGIKSETKNRHQTLLLKPKLKRRQKALLNKLGYNRWRILAKKQK